jgi:hypothetical protein
MKRLKRKEPVDFGFSWEVAGRAGFEPAVEALNPDNHLAGGPIQPLWHLPLSCYQSSSISGGRGIRTPGGRSHTCFQDRRHSPLGHPSSGRVLPPERWRL